MDETDPAVIEDQITYGLAVEAEGGTFFNNFITNMPGDLYRSMIRPDMLDARVTTTDPSDIDQANPLAPSAHSTQVTWREFFGDVDRAVAEAGLDPRELDRLREAFRSAPTREDWHARHLDYTKYVLPVYRSLREQGYSHGDLSR